MTTYKLPKDVIYDKGFNSSSNTVFQIKSVPPLEKMQKDIGPTAAAEQYGYLNSIFYIVKTKGSLEDEREVIIDGAITAIEKLFGAKRIETISIETLRSAISDSIDGGYFKKHEEIKDPDTSVNIYWFYYENQEIESLADIYFTYDDSQNSLNQGEGFTLAVFDYSRFDEMFEDLLISVERNGVAYEHAYRTGEYNVPNLRFGHKIRILKGLKAKIDFQIVKSRIKRNNIVNIALKAKTNSSRMYIESVQLGFPGVYADETLTIESPQDDEHYGNSIAVNFMLNMHNISEEYRAQEEGILDYQTFIQNYYFGVPAPPREIQLDESCGTPYEGSYSETKPGPEQPGNITTPEDTEEKQFPDKEMTASEKREYNRKLRDSRRQSRKVERANNKESRKKEKEQQKRREEYEKSQSKDQIYEESFNKKDRKSLRKELAMKALRQLEILPPKDAEKQTAISTIQSASSQDLLILYKKTVLREGTRRGKVLDLSVEFRDEWVERYETSGPNFSEEGSNYTVSNQNLSQTNPYNGSPNIGVPNFSSETDIDRVRKVYLQILQDGEIEGENPFPYRDFLKSCSFMDDSGLLGGLTGAPPLPLPTNRAKLPIASSMIPPLVPPFASFGDFTKIGIEIATKQIEQVVTDQLLGIVQQLMAEVPPALAGRASNQLALGSDAMTSIMRDNTCSKTADDLEVAAKANQILDKSAAYKTLAENPPPIDEEVDEFMKRSSEVLTFQELTNLFDGYAPPGVLNKLDNVIESLPTDTMRKSFPTKSDIEFAFTSLGATIDRSALRRAGQNILNNNSRQGIVGVCDPVSNYLTTKEMIKEDLIQRAGLDEDEADARAEESADRVLREYGNLVNNIISKDPLGLSNEEKSEVLNSQENATKKAVSDLFKDIFESIDLFVIQDLTSGKPFDPRKRGFFDMILSSVDKKPGKPYSNTSPKNRKSEATEVISSLKTGYYESGDYLGTVDQDSLSFVFNSPDRKNLVVKYDYLKRLQIQDEEDARGDIKEVLPLQVDDVSIKDFVNKISPLDDDPKNIFSGFTNTSLRGLTSGYKFTPTERENFLNLLNRTSNIIKNTEFSEIINLISDSYVRKAVIANEDSWIYGKGEVNYSVKDIDAEQYQEEYGEEYEEGSWYPEIERTFTGWRKIYDESVPQRGDFSDAKTIFNFDSVQNIAKEYNNLLSDDPRAELPQDLFDQMKEYPFSRVNSKINNSLLAAMLMSKIKLYVFDSLVKGMAFFRIYQMNEQSYGDMFLSYMVESIIEDVRKEAKSIPFYRWKKLRANGYYYIFIEQVGQLYSNMVNVGIIEPNQSTILATQQLTTKMREWRNIKSNNKNFKTFIEESLPLVRPMLSQIVAKIINDVGEETKEVLEPLSPGLREDAVGTIFGSGNILDVPKTKDEENSQEPEEFDPDNTLSNLDFTDEKERLLKDSKEQRDKIDKAESKNKFKRLQDKIKEKQEEYQKEKLNLVILESLLEHIKDNKKIYDKPKGKGKLKANDILDKAIESADYKDRIRTNVANNAAAAAALGSVLGVGAASAATALGAISIALVSIPGFGLILAGTVGLVLGLIASLKSKKTPYEKAIESVEKKISDQEGAIETAAKNLRNAAEDVSTYYTSEGVFTAMEKIRQNERDLDKLKSDLIKSAPLPFVMQKYVKISNEEDYKIIAIDEYDSLSSVVKSEYPRISYGIRICYYAGSNYESAITETSSESVMDAVFEKNRSYSMIPLVVYEQEVENFNRDEFPSDSLLKEEIIQTTAFNVLFEKCLMMPQILASLTIYNIENFNDSLKEVRDYKRAVGTWDGETFMLTKKFITQMIEQSYYARTPQYSDEIMSELGNSVANVASKINESNSQEVDLSEYEADDEEGKSVWENVNKLPSWKRKLEIPQLPSGKNRGNR